jgi:hypothetical protein
MRRRRLLELPRGTACIKLLDSFQVNPFNIISFSIIFFLSFIEIIFFGNACFLSLPGWEASHNSFTSLQ